MKLPNELSILIGVALVAALTAIAGELPETAQGWIPLAAAAVIGGIAKAVQVWVNERREQGLIVTPADNLQREPFNWRRATKQWLLG